MMEGVASVAGIGQGAKDIEVFGETLGIVAFVGISEHPRSLETPDMECKSVRLAWVVFSLMEVPWFFWVHDFVGFVGFSFLQNDLWLQSHFDRM